MTLEEYFDELDAMPLQRMDVEHLGRLSSFTPVSPLVADDAHKLEEAKWRIREEVSRRAAQSDRLEETAFRRQERHEADRHHGEHVAQIGHMHVAQMERAQATFVIHRKFMWLAVVIAVASALLAWASLWKQRNETRETLKRMIDRLEALEERSGVKKFP